MQQKLLVTLEQLKKDYPAPVSVHTDAFAWCHMGGYGVGGAFCHALQRASSSRGSERIITYRFPSVDWLAQYLKYYDNNSTRNKSYYCEIARNMVENNDANNINGAWEILGNFLSEANARKEE